MPNMFVKLSVTYYDDIAIAVADDAAEVMFTRGLALCGRLRSGGFIPDAKILELTRRTTVRAARRVADRLCEPPAPDVDPPWMRVEGGYQVRNWVTWQDRLDALEERRRSDRERQRNRRTRGKKGDPSRDGHVTVTDAEEEEEQEAAAAAPRGSRSSFIAIDKLHPSIGILADKLHAWTPLRGLRFDSLTRDQADHIVALLDLHGDHALIEAAKTTTRAIPPTLVNAYIGTWAAMPAPGQRLAAVDDSRCHTCSHTRRAHPWPGCDTYTETRTA